MTLFSLEPLCRLLKTLKQVGYLLNSAENYPISREVHYRHPNLTFSGMYYKDVKDRNIVERKSSTLWIEMVISLAATLLEDRLRCTRTVVLLKVCHTYGSSTGCF